MNLIILISKSCQLCWLYFTIIGTLVQIFPTNIMTYGGLFMNFCKQLRDWPPDWCWLHQFGWVHIRAGSRNQTCVPWMCFPPSHLHPSPPPPSPLLRLASRLVFFPSFWVGSFQGGVKGSNWKGVSRLQTMNVLSYHSPPPLVMRPCMCFLPHLHPILSPPPPPCYETGLQTDGCWLHQFGWVHIRAGSRDQTGRGVQTMNVLSPHLHPFLPPSLLWDWPPDWLMLIPSFWVGSYQGGVKGSNWKGVSRPWMGFLPPHPAPS